MLNGQTKNITCGKCDLPTRSRRDRACVLQSRVANDGIGDGRVGCEGVVHHGGIDAHQHTAVQRVDHHLVANSQNHGAAGQISGVPHDMTNQRHTIRGREQSAGVNRAGQPREGQIGVQVHVRLRVEE